MSALGFTPISLYFSTTAAATPSAGNLASGELALNITDGKLFYKDNGGSVQVLATKAGASGDVVGPGSSTDNALVRFDTTTGKLVQNSVGILSDAGALSGLTDISASGSVTLSGGTAYGVAYLNGSKVLTTGSGFVFDSSGNLGLGVAPSAWVGQTAFQVSDASFSGRGNTADLMMNAYFDASNYRYVRTFFASRYQQQDGAHRWSIAPSGTAGNAISFTQAMTLDASGNLLVGITAVSDTPANGVVIRGDVSGTSGAVNVGHASGVVTGTAYMNFAYNGGGIGSITQNGTTGVLYNTVSDARLKTVKGAVSGHGERIDALLPVEYEWKADGTKARGFLAHQFQEVYAGSVTGSKDAVDADGKPVYQQMEPSTPEVMADLVAEIQSLRARVLALESN
jgi:hypothetical protein